MKGSEIIKRLDKYNEDRQQPFKRETLWVQRSVDGAILHTADKVPAGFAYIADKEETK